jgi:hypothetical protein
MKPVHALFLNFHFHILLPPYSVSSVPIFHVNLCTNWLGMGNVVNEYRISAEKHEGKKTLESRRIDEKIVK